MTDVSVRERAGGSKIENVVVDRERERESSTTKLN